MAPSPPSYIPVPRSAIPIDAPSASASSSTPRPLPRTNPSFPPSTASASAAGPSTARKSIVPPSISTNVSDLLLSSLLPPHLPKLPPASSGSGRGPGPGRPRELSTQRDALSLPLMSNNFRRFVTRVGPLFWIQDRVEEVLFWRKPVWTWAWLLAWTLISFKPGLLLLIPSASVVVLLLHIHERSTPLPSLLGVPTHSSAAGTTRLASAGDSAFSATTTVESDGGTTTIPAVPPKEAESGVDYYMNLQAIQNTMGWISDAYDELAPLLTQLTSPTTSPTAFPITPTVILLLLLPPSLLLPLAPPWLIPYILLPLGILPTLVFHPNISPLLVSLPRNPTLLAIRHTLEQLVLTDALPDAIGSAEISRVEVWENERLDPSWSPKAPLPPNGAGAYAAKFLRAGERAPWVKVAVGTSTSTSTNEIGSIWKSAGGDVAEGDQGAVLALKEGWDWIPSEEWRVDVCGLWSEVGTDEGWVYSDDSWQSLLNAYN